MRQFEKPALHVVLAALMLMPFVIVWWFGYNLAQRLVRTYKILKFTKQHKRAPNPIECMIIDFQLAQKFKY